MILKFNQFYNENFRGYTSIIEYLSSLAEDNDYAKKVISDFTKDVDPSVSILNSLKTLDDQTLSLIVKMIDEESKIS